MTYAIEYAAVEYGRHRMPSTLRATPAHCGRLECPKNGRRLWRSDPFVSESSQVRERRSFSTGARGQSLPGYRVPSTQAGYYTGYTSVPVFSKVRVTKLPIIYASYTVVSQSRDRPSPAAQRIGHGIRRGRAYGTGGEPIDASDVASQRPQSGGGTPPPAPREGLERPAPARRRP